MLVIFPLLNRLNNLYLNYLYFFFVDILTFKPLVILGPIFTFTNCVHVKKECYLIIIVINLICIFRVFCPKCLFIRNFYYNACIDICKEHENP